MDKRCEPETIEEVLERVEEAGADGRRVSVADIVDEIGDDAFAPLMLVPALVALSPATAIFGLATMCGLTIALIAGQVVCGRKKLWLPDLVLRQTISSRRREQIVAILLKPAHIVDQLTRKRLAALVAPPFERAWAALCMLLALAMPALELIPLSASVISGAIALFCLSLLAKDGLLALVGLLVLGGAGWLLWTLLT